MTLGQPPYRPLLGSGHAQTVVGRYWPIPEEDPRFPARERLFRTEPDVQVLAHENRGEASESTPTLLILHGLAASSTAPYVRRSTQTALAAGYNVIRPNVRNCGGTEHLSPTLYHSGLTSDLRFIIDELGHAPLYLLGFSMGGNIALKLAGEWDDEPPPHVRGDLWNLRTDPPRALRTRTRPPAQSRLRVALHEDAAANPAEKARVDA